MTPTNPIQWVLSNMLFFFRNGLMFNELIPLHLPSKRLSPIFYVIFVISVSKYGSILNDKTVGYFTYSEVYPLNILRTLSVFFRLTATQKKGVGKFPVVNFTTRLCCHFGVEYLVFCLNTSCSRLSGYSAFWFTGFVLPRW